MFNSPLSAHWIGDGQEETSSCLSTLTRTGFKGTAHSMQEQELSHHTETLNTPQSCPPSNLYSDSYFISTVNCPFTLDSTEYCQHTRHTPVTLPWPSNTHCRLGSRLSSPSFLFCPHRFVFLKDCNEMKVLRSPNNVLLTKHIVVTLYL